MAEINYSPRGGDGDFLTPFKKPRKEFLHEPKIGANFAGAGRRSRKKLFSRLATGKKRIDRYLENVVLNSPILRSDPIQGGDHVTPQERLLEIKEEHEGYQALSHNIERMEAFLGGLSDEERALVDLHYCQGLEFWEISFKLKKERGDVMRILFSIQKRLGAFWMGEGEVA